MRTKQIGEATYYHPVTKEKIWFNQAHLFHVSSLSTVSRESLMSVVKTEDLPRNVYFGDGSDIEYEALNHIRESYTNNTIIFNWQEGDLLLLDNMLFAHGRQPYSGNRRVLVGMVNEMDAKIQTLQNIEMAVLT